MDEIFVRRMNREDVEIAVKWAALEGWNPGLHDASSFYAADPNGFFMAEINGEPVGCISAVAYDANFGFIGFYIVKDGLRHHGIGMGLFGVALTYLGNRTSGGDGVLAMLEKYEGQGYRIAHRNARYEGVGRDAGVQPRESGKCDFAELEDFDRRYFPAPRGAFLKSWVSRPGSSLRVVREAGRITGYGVIRPCQTGFKIAPLFANTPAAAEELFVMLSSLADGAPVFLDIPACNQRAREMAERHGMRLVFETARMYNGKFPPLPLNDIYGITSFELG